MKKTLLLVTLLSLQAYAKSESVLCGQAFNNQLSFSSHVLTSRDSQEFSLITWNAHKLADDQFMPDLVNLAQNADIIFIQEAMHEANLQNDFTSKFSMHFSFHKSFCNGDKEATGVMTATRYEMDKSTTIVSPDTEPFTFTPKVSGYSVIEIPEVGKVHLINTHGLNFNTGSKFERQMNHLAEFIKTLDGPVIWAGDFNTWTGGRKDHLLAKTKSLGLSHLKPSQDKRNLKLDHVFARGLEVIDVNILNEYKSSDHLPIKVTFKKK
ncbi:MAG: endonuclease/exonuclease/phosphatase family protein [Pseudobdellovibrio sp.]